MSEPVRKRLEQPSEEKAKRSGCLMWGGVLGVLVGIMVGIYALPPILKHYYGETVVEADEFYRGDGKAIRVLSVAAFDPVGETSPGTRREGFIVAISVVADDDSEVVPSNFSLELAELDDWQEATEAVNEGVPIRIVPKGNETEVDLHFVVDVPRDHDGALVVEALHLSDPRVKFEIAPP